MEAKKVGSLYEITYKTMLFAKLSEKPTVAELEKGAQAIEKMHKKLGKKLHPSNAGK